MKKFLLPLLLPIVLAGAALMAGCAAPAPAAPTAAAAPAPAPEPQPQCSAEGAQFAVGQPMTPQLEAAARVRTGSGIVRVLKPDDAATTELDGSRLTIDVDARNRVIDVRCG